MVEARGEALEAELTERDAADRLLRAPVAYMQGVGPSRAGVLAKLGARRAFDLLFYFPRDYQEIRLKRTVDELVEDEVQSVVGIVQHFNTRYAKRVSINTIDFAVGDDLVQGVWFNVDYVSRFFTPGLAIMLTGAPKRSKGRWQFVHPKTTVLTGDFDPTAVEPGERVDGVDPYLRILPVYSLTDGISQGVLQGIQKNALKTLPDLLPEALPKELLESRGVLPIADAIRKMHFPATLDEAKMARRRFVYQELLTLQLALAICRARRRVNMRALPLPRSTKIDSRIKSLFPFEFTEAQNKAIGEIGADMALPTPMNRLLQGDVGSGKTAVAIYAALLAVANGAQAALMAPTEVLARQHLRTFQQYLRNSSVKIAPFFGGQKASEREEILRDVQDGTAQIIIGTQALVYNEIEFKRLGLAIVDEQHKFGVRQRAALKSSLKIEPHYLVMTATPIPRSMTMTLFGDLDVSVMRGAPPGRRKTTTSILTNETRASWWKFVRDRLDEGRQAYVVVARVDDGSNESERDSSLFEGCEIRKLENDGTHSSDFDLWNNWEGPGKEREARKRAKGALSAESEPVDEENRKDDGLKTVWSVYQELSTGELKGYRLGVVHGRMTTVEKDAIMLDFRCGAIQVLVATSVVEVGVDVPNATIMTIEDAERFGLAQLHQLRGRVSRGSHPGFCAVAPSESCEEGARGSATSQDADNESGKMKKKSRGKKGTESSSSAVAEDRATERRRAEAMERLEFFARTTDGFELAEKDFALRGPGELFGARQHGTAALRVADLALDRDVLEEARQDAFELVARDPGLAAPELSALRRQVLARYGRALDLGDVG